MAFVTFEQYSSHRNDIADAKDFERIAQQAEIKLNTITHMRAKKFEDTYDESTATDFQRQVHQQIMDTCCSLIGAMYQQSISGKGSGITSVSNDGYSETYRIQTADELEAQLTSVIRSGLSGTGLAGAL